MITLAQAVPRSGQSSRIILDKQTLQTPAQMAEQQASQSWGLGLAALTLLIIAILAAKFLLTNQPAAKKKSK